MVCVFKCVFVQGVMQLDLLWQNRGDLLIVVHPDFLTAGCPYCGWRCWPLMGCSIFLLLVKSKPLILLPLIFLSWRFIHHICLPHFHCRLTCSQHHQSFWHWVEYDVPGQIPYQWYLLFLVPCVPVFLPWWLVLLFCWGDKNFTRLLIGDDKGFPLQSCAWCGPYITHCRWYRYIQDTNPNFFSSQVALLFLIVAFTL